MPLITDLFSMVSVPLFTFPHAYLLALLHFLNYFNFSFSHLHPLSCKSYGFLLCFPGDLFRIPLWSLNNLESIILGVLFNFKKFLLPLRVKEMNFISCTCWVSPTFSVWLHVCAYTQPEERFIQTQYFPKVSVGKCQQPGIPVPCVVRGALSCQQWELMETAWSSLSMSAKFPFRIVCKDVLLSASADPLISWTDRLHISPIRLGHHASLLLHKYCTYQNNTIQNFRSPTPSCSFST